MISVWLTQRFVEMVTDGFVYNIVKWIRILGSIYTFSKDIHWSKSCHSFSLHLSSNRSMKFIRITQLLPPIILQLRLIQDEPMVDRSPWSIEQFYVFHIHPYLQWSLKNRTIDQNSQNSTFLTSTKNYQTKDVSFQFNSILQFETNCSDSTDEILRYSSDLGSTWFTISNDQQLSFVPIRFDENLYRYTLPFESFLFRNDSIRFEITLNSSCQLQYLYVGDSCPMNCYGQARCSQRQCFTSVAVAPLVSRRKFSTEITDRCFRSRLNFVKLKKHIGYNWMNIDKLWHNQSI